ncbi:hypothetical protein MKA54_21255 [[Clostridium] innocuum]|nr:hypothetical protein [[Clostridium] innocuum]
MIKEDERLSGQEILHHTCKADLIAIRPVTAGDERIREYLGYIPYEYVDGRNYHDK